MNPQAQLQATQKPDIIEHHRLVGLVLNSACRFCHSDSITTRPSGGGAEIAITPARLLATGDWRPVTGDEAPTGFGVAQFRGTGKDRKMYRGWIPMANVAEVLFGE